MATLLHQRRCDLRRGRRLGPGDHVVAWAKPSRPPWMDAATYAGMPEALAVREVRVRVAVPGFRTKVLVVVTTLRDPRAYPARDLAALYRARWHAELDLRTLKITLGMDVLRCKTPAMVRKEVWAHLLAYNLIRTLMAETAGDLGCTPRDLSFKGRSRP
jgi:IS4 transposase